MLLCMGVLGEYIGRVYDEVRSRPLSIINKVYYASQIEFDSSRNRAAATANRKESTESRRLSSSQRTLCHPEQRERSRCLPAAVILIVQAET